LESPFHITTLALITLGFTTDKLLFRERDELAVLDEVEAFKSTSSGESPAGTTVSLILDRSDGTLSSPIDGIGKSEDGVVNRVASALNLFLFVDLETSKILGSEFLGTEVSHMVEDKSRLRVLLVVGGSLDKVFNENGESLDFFRAVIFLVVKSLPSSPEFLHLGSLDTVIKES